MDFLSQLKKHLQKSALIKKGEKIVVAVSGGPDSVALVVALNRLRHEWGLKLHLAHLNHGLRKAGNTDAAFVLRLAAKLDLPLTIKKISLARQKTSGSVEELARHYRFQFLIETARKQKADKIVLAHTRDDLAETVLMRLLRGSGMAGLRAILPRRQIYGTTFIRPLLPFSKAELLAFLKSERVGYRVDQSNRSLKFFRNKIRLKLLPLLEKDYNPNVREVLANCAETVGRDYEYLEKSVQQRLNQWIKPQKNRVVVPLKKVQNLPVNLQRIVIRLSIERLKGNLNTITLAHMREVEDLLAHRPKGSIVHLPQKIAVTKEADIISVAKIF